MGALWAMVVGLGGMAMIEASVIAVRRIRARREERLRRLALASVVERRQHRDIEIKRAA